MALPTQVEPFQNIATILKHPLPLLPLDNHEKSMQTIWNPASLFVMEL